MWDCGKCGAANREYDLRCHQCGATWERRKVTWRCSQCEAPNDPFRTTCEQCGTMRPRRNLREESRRRSDARAELEAAIVEERRMAIQALGLEVGRLRPATTNARGSVGGHRVDLIWRWPGESDPFSKVTVAFDDPIGPAGLRVGRNLRRVPRPAVRRLGDTVVVGARRRRELDEWLTPRRSSVLASPPSL